MSVPYPNYSTSEVFRVSQCGRILYIKCTVRHLGDGTLVFKGYLCMLHMLLCGCTGWCVLWCSCAHGGQRTLCCSSRKGHLAFGDRVSRRPGAFAAVGEAGWLVGYKGPPVASLQAGFFPMSSGVVTQFSLFARYSLYQLGSRPVIFVFHSHPSEITSDTFLMAPHFYFN